MSEKKEYIIKRNEILDCAQQLFMKQGYEVTTVNEILKEIGIAKGTFYYYFKSKEEVMDAVIMRFIEEDLEFTKAILAREDMSAIDKIVTCLFSKPKSYDKKNMIDQMYEANNALMKQRTMQSTIEILCPFYARIITEGNIREEFSSEYPLEDIKFLIAAMQTLYDLTNVKGSYVHIDVEAIANAIFLLLKINPKKVSRDELLVKIRNNLSSN